MGQTVRLTASFKLSGRVPEGLFSAYQEILASLLEYASEKGITSFKRLRAERYRELREKYPALPSHYIYTACQMAGGSRASWSTRLGWGLRVVYIDPRGTSSLCPTCGGKLSLNGHRRLRCPRCGLEEDRDAVAVRNLLRKYQTDVGASSVYPEGPPMTGGGKT
jgi:predicted RNA-binding Zn-ribbon protein involved in translation (DUF1610 family)